MEEPAEHRKIISRSGVGGVVAVFILLLGAHIWGVSRGWHSYNLPGHEFRQSQTALSALFIQREHNFTLSYPTPVLGKPWSAPMEFPLYQWTVVGLSNASGMNLTQSARLVSILSFYLTLPALFLLLGCLGVGRIQRLIVLAFVLSSPLYIFYSRGFLIETMGLMWAMWFLLAFVRALEGRSIGWLVLANLFGIATGLVKSTTFAVFLLPAVLWTWSGFWQSWQTGASRRWKELGRTALWSLAAVIIPVLATFWWTSYADGIKGQNVSTGFLTSESTREFIFGTSTNRFSADTLTSHWRNLTHNLVNPWVLGFALIAAAVWGRRRIGLMGSAMLCFCVPLVVFPTLYAWHDYYAVASGVFILAAVGLAMVGLWQSTLPRPAVGLVLVLLLGTQWWTYGQTYYKMQNARSNGGSGLTQAIKRVTDPEAVVVVAGYDWNSILPYFSERRALMIRAHMEHDWTYLHQAFAALKDEPVTVYVARGEQRQNQTLLGLVEQYFDIDPRPVFAWLDTTVYVRKQKRFVVIEALRRWENNDPGAAKLTAEAAQEDTSIIGREILFDSLLFDDPKTFAMVSPKPWKFYSQFGFRLAGYFGQPALFSHPDTRLWFRVPAGRHLVKLSCTIEPEAYGPDISKYDYTDGVDFVIYIEKADGQMERVGSLFLDPGHVESDRGIRTYEQIVETEEGADIVITTEPGPHGNAARDWAAFAGIDIQTIAPAP